MFKALLFVVALALYGAYALVERLAPPTSAEQRAIALKAAQASPHLPSLAPADADRSLTSRLADAAFGTVANAAGLELKARPADGLGCSASALSAEQLENLLRLLPESQQYALAKVLNASAPVWSAQLYMGAMGYGLCLPMQEKVVLLPPETQNAVEAFRGLLPL